MGQPVFQRMRQSTKTILWIVIVAFIGFMFAVWGMNLRMRGGPQAGFVGVVGGHRISVQEYRDELQRQRAIYYQQHGRRHGSEVERQLHENAWNALVQRYLLYNEARKRKLGVTDREVRMEIEYNPPPEVRASPAFQSDSGFDYQRYRQALDDPRYDFRPLEAFVRATLPISKLEDYMASCVRVTDEEAARILEMFEEKVKISYMVIDPLTDIKQIDVQPTEDELLSYYQSNREEFRLPERRGFVYARFEKKPSAEDIRYSQERITEAWDLIDAGEPFDEIAAEYSDDEATASRGGDLGWIDARSLPTPLDSILPTLVVGKISEVIETDSAFYFLLVENKKKEDSKIQYKVKWVVSKVEPSPMTIQKIVEQAREFASIARHKGIEKAAQETGIELATTPRLTIEETSVEFAIGLEDARSLFNKRKGDVTGVVEGTKAYYVIEIKEVVESRIPEFSECSELVKRSYEAMLRRKEAERIARSIRDATLKGSSLEKQAKLHKLTVRHTDFFDRMSDVPDLGRQNAVIAAAFTLEKGEVSDVIEESGRFYILRLDDAKEVSEEDLRQKLAAVKMSLLSAKKQDFLGRWYNKIKEKAKIKDYRTAEATR